jgi:hypothetical protein
MGDVECRRRRRKKIRASYFHDRDGSHVIGKGGNIVGVALKKHDPINGCLPKHESRGYFGLLFSKI